MGRKINILGVDDKPENLLVLEETLVDLDINLVKAFSGEEALQWLQEEEFALILMDVIMPGLDGYETAALVRKRPKNEQIPIIFISEIYLEQDYIFKGNISGVVDYLSKPINPQILQNKVSVFVELFQQRKNLKEKNAKLQQALHTSEVRFRTAFEQVFQFMAILDSKGRVIELNRLAKNLCGDYPGSLTGQYLWNICWIGQDEENKKLQQVISEAAEGKEDIREVKFIDINGVTRTFYRSVSPVKDEEGNILYINVQGYDVTDKVSMEEEKRSLEKLLRQSQKMEALGALAGGIAHDFNNVLSVIIGNADLAQTCCDEGSSQRRFLDRIHEAGEKAKELVKQILSFSRQAEVEKVPLQPAKVIHESIKLLRSSIPTTIEIIQDVDEGCGSVFADRTQLHQIVMNLCTNAFHAMEEKGGILSLKLTHEEVDASCSHESEGESGDYAHLIVEDNGYGIEEEYLNKIFDPYFTTKEKDKGTGMGLAIVHGIVKGHGGFVRVESKIGKGTAFHVYLPLVNERENLTEEKYEALTYGSERILLVDDEDMLLEMLKNMLELVGYQVTMSNRSRKAFELFCNSPDEFDLVITDQTMPEMTGMELSRRILSVRSGIPIILCTGYSPGVSREGVLAIGIRELVFKPLALDEFSKIIRKVIDQR